VCTLPTAAALEFLAPEHHTFIFTASAAAIVPLAGYIGRATELLGRAGAALRAYRPRQGLAETVPAVFHLLVRSTGSTAELTLVFLSYAIAPEPMDLLFTVFELVAVGMAVLTMTFIAHDGETRWMEGVPLLAVYAILVLGFYFLPDG